MNEDFIYGIHPVLQAIKSGKTIDKIFIKNGLMNNSIKIIQQNLVEKKIRINYVPINKLNRITRKNHQGVIALLSCCKFHSLETVLSEILKNNKNPFLLILDRITDVRNFGALIRTAECAGVDAIILSNTSSAPINHDSMRTSAGALNWIPICKEPNLVHTIDYIHKMGIQVVAASEKATESVFKSQLKKPIAIIIGNEENGIAQNLLKRCDLYVKLPLYGKIESLNVSVACGVILYEIIRQNLH